MARGIYIFRIFLEENFILWLNYTTDFKIWENSLSGAGFSLTPYLEFFTPTFGLGLPFFKEFLQIYIVGLLLFLKNVSVTLIFKILVRTLVEPRKYSITEFSVRVYRTESSKILKCT